MHQKEKLGLVLAGGGGKGAYQLGVWKYLREVDLFNNISVISGTSVGALNAVLFSLDNYDLAEHIWKYKISSNVLKRHVDQEIKIPDGFPGVPDLLLDIVNNGLFSRNGLISIINDYLDLEQLKKSEKNVYATCTKIPEIVGSHFLLNDLEINTICDVLLATSAIPAFFKPERILNHTYMDGGLIKENNIPVNPLLLEKCTSSIIVCLSNSDAPLVENISNSIIIKPSVNLGSVIDGTLNFSQKKATDLIHLGYTDSSTFYKDDIDFMRKKTTPLSDTVFLAEIVSSFKKHENILKPSKKLSAVLQRDFNIRDQVVELTASIYDQNTNTVDKIVQFWKTRNLSPDLNDAFGHTDMVLIK